MKDTKARPRAGERTGHFYAGHDPRVKLCRVDGDRLWKACDRASPLYRRGLSADEAERKLIEVLDLIDVIDQDWQDVSVEERAAIRRAM